MEPFLLFRKVIGSCLLFPFKELSSLSPRWLAESIGDAFQRPLKDDKKRGGSWRLSRLEASAEVFAGDYLNSAVVFSSMDEIVTEVFPSALPAQTWGYLVCAKEHGVVTALEKEVAAFAAKQLIDVFLLERLTGKMSLQGSRLFEKEHSSMVLDSLMLDILLQQFFSIRQWQRATFENVPLRDFHLKAFTEVALDVILAELNKLAVEDMEDLLEYERGVQEQGQKHF